MPETDVEHRGLVTAVGRNQLTVNVNDSKSCGGCAVAAFCGQKSDRGDVTIDVADAAAFAVGDHVRFEPSRASQQRGIVMAFVAPLVLLLACVLALIEWGVDQGVSVLCGLGALAVYYLMLYLGRNRIKLKWTVTKTNY